jgi:hypothetical protein
MDQILLDQLNAESFVGLTDEELIELLQNIKLEVLETI